MQFNNGNIIQRIIRDETNYYDILRSLCGDNFDVAKMKEMKRTDVYEYHLYLEANTRYVIERNKKTENGREHNRT